MDMKEIMDAQREEMLRHKWIESEKAGRDLGDSVMVQWSKDYGADWRYNFNLEHLMELPPNGEAVYFGIFLDDESRERLENAMKDRIPSGWMPKCERCTLAYGDPDPFPEVKEYIAANLGKVVELTVDSIGGNHDALAVGVNGDFKSMIRYPHVPVAIPAGGHSRYSNFITMWERYHMDEPLRGVVDAFPRIFR